MAILYVKSGASNSAPYGTWATAATTLLVATAAAAANDVIYVSNNHSEVPTADTVYVMASGVRIICVNDAAEPPTAPATTALVNGSATTGLDISFNNGPFYIYGITFRCGGGATAAQINICQSADDYGEFEKCVFELSNTNASGNVQLGSASTSVRSKVITKQCSFIWGATTQGFQMQQGWTSIEDDFVAGATAPTTLFEIMAQSMPNILEFLGSDFSGITGTIFEPAPAAPIFARLWGCTLGSGTVFAPTVAGAGEVFVYDSAAADTHYNFAHYTYEGTTVAQTSIFLNTADGAKYDGGNPISWTVTGSANASKAYPYYSPWLDAYNASFLSMQPYLEVLRDGSATKYNDDEVWSEWMAKTTSGSTRATYYTERTIVGTPNALTGTSVGATQWTGEGGSAAFMRLRPDAAFTPQELGHIRVRICAGGAFSIVVNPKMLIP